jgi:hypothetical protein
MDFSMTLTTAPRSACMRLTGDLDYQSIDELVDTASQLLAEQPFLDRVLQVTGNLRSASDLAVAET